MELTIGIQNKETTEAGTLIITMNPVNTAKWIATPELIEAEIAIQSYGVISVPDYENLDATEIMCYVSLDYVTYGAGLADLIAGSIGDEITFTANASGGGGGANDAEITKWIEGNAFTLTDTSASFVATSAFKSVDFLTSVSFENVSDIRSNAFFSCKSLTTADFPEAVSIGNYAFSNCYNLTNISLPKAETIGQQAFGECSALTVLSLPKATSLLQNIATGCISLKSLYLDIFSGALGNGLVSGCTELETVYAPKASGVVGAFTGCVNLSQLDLPNCQNIGSSVFSGCVGLETISIGSAANRSVSIGNYAFSGCTKLSAIYIGNTSTAVGRPGTNAFANCPMTNSTYLGAFGSIYVPASLVSVYTASASWAAVSERITAMPEITAT